MSNTSTAAAAKAAGAVSHASNTSDVSDCSSSNGSAPRRRRSIRIGSVDSRWLFNNFYVGELIVDARSGNAFETETILGAISIPPVAGCTCLADLDNECTDKQSLASLSPRKRTLRDIVIFADRAQISDSKSWMYTLLQLLVADGLVASVKTLSDCFSMFSARYPFYTTQTVTSNNGVIQSGQHRVTYPNEIVDGFLYLGNMWQAESQQVIRDLGITHIVNATLDLGNVFESSGVFYHEVKVRDESMADISRFFDSTFHFINRAKHAASPSWVTATSKRSALPYRVLVHCTQGISRSATLVIMYLMRANHWSLVQAFNYTRAGRGVVIPNEGFLIALLKEELRLHGCESNSVTESEFDALLQGRIPDQPVPPPRRNSGCACIAGVEIACIAGYGTAPRQAGASEREKAGELTARPTDVYSAREGEQLADGRNAVVTSKHLLSAVSAGITAARTARSASSAAALDTTTQAPLTCAFTATQPGEPSSSNATTTTTSITSSNTSMSVGEERKNKTTRPEGPSRTVEVEHVEAPVSQAIVAMPKRHVRTGRVNCRWLYNQVQAARGLILIDARSREAFEEDTIPSSISIPPMVDCFTLDDVEKGMLAEQRYLFTVKRRKLRDVVLFGETVKSKNSRDPRNANADDSENSWLRHLERLIVEDGLVTSVKSLFDGFMTFKYRYPFYTTSAMLDEIAFGLTRTRSGTHNLNYPNEILEGFLFLGNMWHAQSKQVIQNLGITHIVNASLDVENVFATEGVLYKAVKIKDRPEADISAFFDSTYEFIESAKRTYHGRVLVHCTQGISRSATLVIMYLMRANNWSLVTAVNFAMASRGVVYPNEGFFRSLMAEEFRLYKGNSITLDEVDLLLQHQIPDRPVPLQIRNHKSENCSQCSKIFSLLEWKHKCSYCRKEFCSKCTSTRLANPEREKLVTGLEEQRKPRRVCDVCVSRLWKINLPRPRMGLQMRNPKCKHLNVNSLSTFGKPVCISYFEGTEPQVILDVIKTRFEVKTSQIVDISTEIGEPVENVAELPDEAVVLVSIGKAGNVKDFSQRGKTRNRNQSHQQNLVMSPRERVLRGRFSSEGNVDALNEHVTKQKPTNIRRTNSFQLEQLAAMELNDKKFREMWKLSFPTMGVIERQALLKIRNPAILTDVMLGVSSLSCGAMTIQDFNRRLIELGYADSDRELVVALLDKSRRANGLSMC